MMKHFGKKVWIIPEGSIPAYSNGPEPDFTGHEAACILNTGDKNAEIDITIFYTDRAPSGPFKVQVKAKRTLHLRFNNLKDPEPIPLGTVYASVIESSVPIVVQYTRLDSRQSKNALMTAIPYSE